MSNNPGGATYRFLECTVSQYMTSTVQTVTRKVTLRDLEALFEKHDFNAFPVMEAGKMLGIVTKFDFLQAFAFTTSQIVPCFDELMRRTVADIMTEAVVHVEPAASLARVFTIDGRPQEPQLPGHRFQWSVGWYDFTRRRYARTQGDNTESSIMVA
jgi:CBS-domain-containing membrane protein